MFTHHLIKLDLIICNKDRLDKKLVPGTFRWIIVVPRLIHDIHSDHLSRLDEASIGTNTVAFGSSGLHFESHQFISRIGEGQVHICGMTGWT